MPYLVTRSLDPTGVGRARWMMRWKPALDAFAITFGDRFRRPKPMMDTAGNTVSEIVAQPAARRPGRSTDG